MNHLLYFNGTGPAINEMFGCPCNRCNSGIRLANVSVSLISHDGEGNTLHHVLFDVGDGIATSLAQSPWLKHHNGRLDQIVLSHWHRDHTLHLNRVLVANYLRGKRLNIHPNPQVPVWLRTGSAAWLEKLYEYEKNLYMSLEPSGEQHYPGTLLDPIPLPAIPDVTIIPFALSHFTADFGLDRETYVSSCSGFVVQGRSKKFVFFWDADTKNLDWILEPQSAEHEATIDLLSDADGLIIDTTVWIAKPELKHAQHLSFPKTVEIARALRPKVTMPVHISGHPDLPGHGAWGWLDEDWQHHGAKAWQEQEVPGEFYVPSIGDELDL